jgi:hypothetical protein
MKEKKIFKPESYYILLPGQPDEYATYESNLLGELDINGTFWVGSGLNLLMELINTNSNLLIGVIIKTSKNKKLEIEEFVDLLRGYKIKYDNLERK